MILLALVNDTEPIGYNPCIHGIRILTFFVGQVRLDFGSCQSEVVLGDQYARREKMAQPKLIASTLEASESFVSEFVLIHEGSAQKV